jgi:hypothetical protein
MANRIRTDWWSHRPLIRYWDAVDLWLIEHEARPAGIDKELWTIAACQADLHTPAECGQAILALRLASAPDLRDDV